MAALVHLGETSVGHEHNCNEPPYPVQTAVFEYEDGDLIELHLDLPDMGQQMALIAPQIEDFGFHPLSQLLWSCCQAVQRLHQSGHAAQVSRHRIQIRGPAVSQHLSDPFFLLLLALAVFVMATVISGTVAWESSTGQEAVVTPQMGPVKLAFDPSLGSVADREGLVFIKPVMGQRWTLADEDTLIEKGDWVKTAARGANAAELRLKDGARLVLGPAVGGCRPHNQEHPRLGGQSRGGPAEGRNEQRHRPEPWWLDGRP